MDFSLFFRLFNKFLFEPLSHKNMENAILAGWLYKQGERGLVKGWKKRWFIVSPDAPDVIRYQRKANDQEEKGVINLSHVTNVRVNDKGDQKQKGEYSFQVETPNRIYYRSAKDQESVNYWVEGIKKVRILFLLYFAHILLIFKFILVIFFMK